MGTGTKLNKESAPQVESMPGFDGRYAREDGYVLGFESFDEAADFTPMYRGLPDDRCQSHHWGYVIKGRMIMHRPEGDIVAEEGEAYYVGPGTRARPACRAPRSSSSVRPPSTTRPWRSWRRTWRPQLEASDRSGTQTRRRDDWLALAALPADLVLGVLAHPEVGRNREGTGDLGR
jgi:hypothetical protein